MSEVKNILVVCTGNSCRSVMAGGLLKDGLKDKGDYTVVTAGIAAFEGMRPTPETIQVMVQQGIDVSGHLSQPLSDELIQQADLILVMELRHKVNILNRFPDAENKVELMSEFGRMEGEYRLVNPDIPDPIGRPLGFYSQVLGMIRESTQRAINKITDTSV